MYSISFSDPSKENKLIIPTAGNNTETSLVLFGQNKEQYGVDFWENILHLVENFCNPHPPKPAIQGQLWYNSDNKNLFVYDGEWNNVIKTHDVDLTKFINKSRDDTAVNLKVNKIPTDPNDAATKEYVDNYHGGIKTAENTFYSYVLYPNKFIIIHGNNGGNGGNVKLPFEMADNNYGSVITGVNSSNHYNVTNKTTSGFTINSNQWLVTGFIK
jgi:hypothetical protein